MTLAPLLLSFLVGGGASGSASGHLALPSPEDVAGVLHWESGRLCRDLIDACLDENGDSMVQLPEYEVSNLKCRRMPEERATCSFASARKDGDRITARESCKATFTELRDAYGNRGWQFARHKLERPRLSSAPILTCN